MEWTARKAEVQAQLDALIEGSADVLGPHRQIDDDDPTTELSEGTWVIAGYALVIEWRLIDDLEAVDVPGGEYIRLFRSRGLSDTHSAGLLHTALYDMD